MTSRSNDALRQWSISTEVATVGEFVNKRAWTHVLESIQNFVALFLTFVFSKRANMQTVFVFFVRVKNGLNILLVSSNRAEYLSSRY